MKAKKMRVRKEKYPFPPLETNPEILNTMVYLLAYYYERKGKDCSKCNFYENCNNNWCLNLGCKGVMYFNVLRIARKAYKHKKKEL